MCSDRLSSKEVEYTTRILKELQAVGWASPLLSKIEKDGGITVANQPLLFEARFAYELFRRDKLVQYEYSAGVDDSKIDFRITNSKEWLIELVSVRESEGMQSATEKSRNFFRTILLSNNLKKTARLEQKQSEESEMMIVQGKIGEKVLDRKRGRPTKFPVPNIAKHAILVDMRGYIGQGADYIDYLQIAYGPDGMPPGSEGLIHYNLEDQPIRGLFEKLNKHPIEAAILLQKRVHLLGFILEKKYRKNEIAEACLLTNRLLVPPALENEIKQAFPLSEKCG